MSWMPSREYTDGEVCVIAHAPVDVSGNPIGFTADRIVRTQLQDDTCSSWVGESSNVGEKLL